MDVFLTLAVKDLHLVTNPWGISLHICPRCLTVDDPTIRGSLSKAIYFQPMGPLKPFNGMYLPHAMLMYHWRDNIFIRFEWETHKIILLNNVWNLFFQPLRGRTRKAFHLAGILQPTPSEWKNIWYYCQTIFSYILVVARRAWHKPHWNISCSF